MQNETKGMVYGLIGVAAFGLTLPITRVVVLHMDPVFIGLGRAVVAALLSIMILLALQPRIPNAQQIQQLAVVALGVVLGILPLATAVFGAFIGTEKPSFAFWVVSIIGSALVVLYALLQGSGMLHFADIARLGAVISAAMGYAVGASLAKTMGGWQVICWANVLALPFILGPAIYKAPELFLKIPNRAYIGFLYLALVSQFLAFFAWYKGLALGGIARVSQTQLLQPVITLLASVLFIGELIDTETLVFIFLVVFSVWLSKKMPIENKTSQSISSDVDRLVD